MIRLETSVQDLTSPGAALSRRTQWEDKLTALFEAEFAKFLELTTEKILQTNSVNSATIQDDYASMIQDVLSQIEASETVLQQIQQSLFIDTLADDVYDTANVVMSQAQAEGYTVSERNELITLALDLESSEIELEELTAAGAVAGQVARGIGSLLARKGVFRRSGQKKESRVKTAARTSSTDAYAAMQLEVMKESEREGFHTHKQWVTRRDDLVRQSHADADAQTVPINSDFQVGSSALEYPGQSTGPAEEVINCRCIMVALNP